jgi:hypothetical protein
MTQEQKRLDKLVRKLQAKAASRAPVNPKYDSTLKSSDTVNDIDTRIMFNEGKKKPFTE